MPFPPLWHAASPRTSPSRPSHAVARPSPVAISPTLDVRCHTDPRLHIPLSPPTFAALTSLSRHHSPIPLDGHTRPRTASPSSPSYRLAHPGTHAAFHGTLTFTSLIAPSLTHPAVARAPAPSCRLATLTTPRTTRRPALPHRHPTSALPPRRVSHARSRSESHSPSPARSLCTHFHVHATACAYHAHHLYSIVINEIHFLNKTAMTISRGSGDGLERLRDVGNAR